MSRSVGTTYTFKSWVGEQLLNAQNVFIVAGQQSAWDADPDVDPMTPGTTTPSEPVVAIQPYLITMAAEVTEGDYELLDLNKRTILTISGVIKYFEFIDNEDIYTRNANYYLAIAAYNPALGHPTPTGDNFRAYYLAIDVEPAAGYENASYLEPAQVEDYGKVFYANHGTAIPIGVGEFSVDLPVLIEMR